MNPWFRCLDCGRPAELDGQDLSWDTERMLLHAFWVCPVCGESDAYLTEPQHLGSDLDDDH